MQHLHPNLRKAKNLKEVMRTESHGSNAYFKKLFAFDSIWNWTGRHGKYGSGTPRHAVDPINSMLNLGYGLLAQGMSEIVIKRGFEPSIGFLHVNSMGRYWNNLAYDLIEPYRVWVDSAVKEMIVNEKIKPVDFAFSNDKSSMVLKDKAFEIVLDKFMTVLEPLEYKSLPMIRKVEAML